MWDLLEGTSLLDRPEGEDEYDAHVHLARIVALLGEPPERVISRERFFRGFKLERPVTGLRGEKCETMNEFWGGPFFDDDGESSLGGYRAGPRCRKQGADCYAHRQGLA